MKIIKKYFPLIIAGVALVIYFSLRTKKDSDLNNYSIKSVAKVYKLIRDTYVYSQYRYEFFHEGKRYTAQRGLGEFDAKTVINNFYEVEFLPENPETSRINLNLRIKDSQRILNAGFKKE